LLALVDKEEAVVGVHILLLATQAMLTLAAEAALGLHTLAVMVAVVLLLLQRQLLELQHFLVELRKQIPQVVQVQYTLLLLLEYQTQLHLVRINYGTLCNS
jgi:hypothetical protein